MSARPRVSGHRLTIVVPALDEEDSIGETLRRCLAAREHIASAGGVEEIEILVVSDGSRDRTEEIAAGFDEVTVLVFEQNRGYGAALQAGFAHGSGDLVAFLDADGTCDPRFFADLCRALDEEDADVALGSRLGEESRMPLVRAVGNRVLAWTLGRLAKREVRDTASGMRVIRRACLPDLYPLPDGLHFTPAMSARVLMEDKLRLVERPMPYAERTGRSKLNVVRDGFRFLVAILFAAAAFRPARPALAVAAGVAGMAVLAGLAALGVRLETGAFGDPGVYLALAASLLATVASLFVGAAVAGERIAAAAHDRPPAAEGLTGLASRPFTRRGRRIGAPVLLGAALLLSWPAPLQLLRHGEVTVHWLRPVVAGLLVVVAAMHAGTTFLLNMMELIEAQRAYAPGVRPPERIHPARRPVYRAPAAEAAEAAEAAQRPKVAPDFTRNS